MKKLRALALISIPTFFSLAGLLVACGDDDTVVTGDGGVDGTSPDAQPDTEVPEAGPDTGLDAGPPPKSVADFAAQVETALCGSFTRCCFGDANLADGGAVDGGRYDANECGRLYKGIGFEFSSTGHELVDGGEAAIDGAKALACLDRIKNLPCALTGPEMTAARATCFDAIVGARTTGQPCEGSIECAKGNFCDPDGGTCAPLRGAGGACSIFDTGSDERDSVRSEEACSWRGSGDTQLRCDSYNAETGVYRARGDWKCQPQVEADAGCNSTVWCKDAICDAFDGYYCKSPVEIFTNYCGRVVVP